MLQDRLLEQAADVKPLAAGIHEQSGLPVVQSWAKAARHLAI